MRQYNANNIKNIAVIGHGGSGKTSLVEALLFKTGASDRLGKILESNTISDFDPEEIKRKSSINLSIAPFEFKDCKFNLLDAPGLFDFENGLCESIRACESAIITVSGKSGITVGAKKAYNLAKEYNKSRMIFVSKMDRESADFYKVLEQLKTSFGPSVFPLVVPFASDRTIECYINLIDMKAYKYVDGVPQEVDMPQNEHRLDGLINAISEAVAETDDELFEKYFSGESFSHDELIRGIHKGIKTGDITPVFCGSAFTMEAMDLFLSGMYMLLPSALESAVETAVDENDNEVAVLCDEDKPLVAHIFKTVADPFVGKLSYVKVISGKLSSDLTPVNMSTGEPEKLGKLVFLKGKKQDDTKVIPAGDIGAVTKLNANTGDTLCLGTKVTLSKIEFPIPCYSMAIIPVNKGDESKISQGMHRLLEEDLTLSFTTNPETHQQIISGLGEQHLDVTISKLKAKFAVDVTLEPPIIAYRETIRKKVKVEGKHKKQSGGHGQFGHVWIEFEPCDADDLVFEEKVFGGAVPKSYFPAVEKGLRDSIKKGVLAGYPVVGLKAILVDGSYHPVDSSEMSFKMAANLAYKNGMPQASPSLLEPIGKLLVTTPDSHTGDIMGELNKRRGRVLGMNPAKEGQTTIEADVPMSEMHDFVTFIRQITQGAGSFTFNFERYEALPANLEADVVAKAKSFANED